MTERGTRIDDMKRNQTGFISGENPLLSGTVTPRSLSLSVTDPVTSHRCPPPSTGKHTPTHPAFSAPDGHPLLPSQAENLQCRPRRGHALTPPTQTLRTPQCTPPVTARPGPAHAATPAAACVSPAPYSPAPNSMGRTCEHKAEHAGPPAAESLPNCASRIPGRRRPVGTP